MDDCISLEFGPQDDILLGPASAVGGNKPGELWIEIGDWGFILSKDTVDKLVELLKGLIRETFFEPQFFQLDPDGGLTMLVEVDRDGVQMDLYQRGEYTRQGVTIPHSRVLEVVSTMEEMSAQP